MKKKNFFFLSYHYNWIHFHNIQYYKHMKNFQLYLYRSHCHDILHYLLNIHWYLFLVFIYFINLFDCKIKGKFIPLQVIPSPEYPELHSQLNPPIVFVQFALTLHPPLFIKHSLISIWKCKHHWPFF